MFAGNKFLFKFYTMRKIHPEALFSLLEDALWSVRCNYKANSITATPAATMTTTGEDFKVDFLFHVQNVLSPNKARV